MAVIRGKTLQGEVELDGNEYHECIFDGATLIFRGTTKPVCVGCKVRGGALQLRDAAAITMQGLAIMYRHGPTAGMIENAFAVIRRQPGTVYKDQTLTGRLHLDGADIRNCTLHDVALVIRGERPFQFDGAVFTGETGFVFEGPADVTFSIFEGLYKNHVAFRQMFGAEIKRWNDHINRSGDLGSPSSPQSKPD